MNGHSDVVSSLIVLPDKSLISGSRDTTIRIWKVSNDTTIKILKGHNDWVKELVLLSNGNLASGGHDLIIRIWDIKSGETVRLLYGHTDWVITMVVLSNGNLVSAGDDGIIRIWDINSYQTIKKLTDDQAIGSLLVLPNGNLASGSGEYISIWDLDIEKKIKVLNFTSNFPLIFKKASTYSLAMLPDRRLASGHRNGHIRIWTLFR